MKKKRILEIYNKYVEEIYKKTDEIQNMQNKLIELEDELLKKLSINEKEIFNEILECENCRSCEVNKQTFIYAFSLATELIIESLNNNEKSE